MKLLLSLSAYVPFYILQISRKCLELQIQFTAQKCLWMYVVVVIYFWQQVFYSSFK